MSWLAYRDVPRVPEETVHAYGFLPPDAEIGDEYGVPFVPFGSEVVVMTRG